MAGREGFTLIELMVVIAIIAILSTVGFVSFTNAQIASRDARRKQDLRSLEVALELYYQQNRQYPPDYSYSTDNRDGGGVDWYSRFKNEISPFINSLPKDPMNGQGVWNGGRGPWYAYAYATCGTFQCYHLCATLENKNDKDINVTSGNSCTGDGATTWNFEIDSPN